MMTIRVRALVRGAVVSLAAITMVFTVAVVPAYASTPTISMFSPPSGQPGTLVSVTGNGFTGGIAGVSAVTFNNVGTTFNVSDDQHLTATVPIGATTGKIGVTTSDGVGTSVNSFVVAVNPTISSFSPSSGSPGTAVTINGSGFTGVNGVKFNDTSATFNFVSDAQVMTTVPAGATTGKVTVTTSAGTATSASNFTVSGSSSAPTISSFSPVERSRRYLGHDQREPFHRRERCEVQRDDGELQLRERREGDGDGPLGGDDREGHRHDDRGDRDERFELHRD